MNTPKSHENLLQQESYDSLWQRLLVSQQCELVKEEMKLKPVIKLKKMLSQLKMMPG